MVANVTMPALQSSPVYGDVPVSPSSPLYGDLPGMPGQVSGADGGSIAVGTGAGAAAAAGGTTTAAASNGGLINTIWEYISRAILLLCGFVLIFIALVAMLWQSKTVQTTAKTLAAGAL